MVRYGGSQTLRKEHLRSGRGAGVRCGVARTRRAGPAGRLPGSAVPGACRHLSASRDLILAKRRAFALQMGSNVKHPATKKRRKFDRKRLQET